MHCFLRRKRQAPSMAIGRGLGARRCAGYELYRIFVYPEIMEVAEAGSVYDPFVPGRQFIA